MEPTCHGLTVGDTSLFDATQFSAWFPGTEEFPKELGRAVVPNIRGTVDPFIRTSFTYSFRSSKAPTWKVPKSMTLMAAFTVKSMSSPP